MSCSLLGVYEPLCPVLLDSYESGAPDTQGSGRHTHRVWGGSVDCSASVCAVQRNYVRVCMRNSG